MAVAGDSLESYQRAASHSPMVDVMRTQSMITWTTKMTTMRMTMTMRMRMRRKTRRRTVVNTKRMARCIPQTVRCFILSRIETATFVRWYVLCSPVRASRQESSLDTPR